MANVLAFRYGGQPLDLTREGTYSLSSETLTQVKSLDRPVTFTMISGHEPAGASQRDRVEQLLESYRTINPQHDPDRADRTLTTNWAGSRSWPSGSRSWRCSAGAGC